MEKTVIYGITFIQDKVNDDTIILRPSYIIEGTVYDKTLIDKYENVYTKINLNTIEKTGSCMYGLGIDEDTLLSYYKNQGRREGEEGYTDVCAKFYFDSIQKYIFVIKKKDDKKVSYAYNLDTNKVKKVNLRNNAFEFIDESYGLKAEVNQEDVIEEIEEDNNISSLNVDRLINNIKKRVVGQDAAVESVVITVCKNKKYADFQDMKGNVLLYGPTGCGKTEIVRSLADELDVPCIIEDMTPYTASGYVGDSVKQILKRLYIVSGKNMDKAEQGIVLLDEFDKLASTSSSNGSNKTDVQYELLKIIEGAKININDSNRDPNELIMDTSNITFILAGAFTDLYEVKEKPQIGFNKGDVCDKKVEEFSTMDLKKFGIIKEIIGRISVKAPIKKLGTEELKDILDNSSISCLRNYEKAFLDVDKVKIVYEDRDEFVTKVADKAIALDVGARGLKLIVDETFSLAFKAISNEPTVERELFVTSKTIDDPKRFELREVSKKEEYKLKKVRRGNNELSKRTGEANS